MHAHRGVAPPWRRVAFVTEVCFGIIVSRVHLEDITLLLVWVGAGHVISQFRSSSRFLIPAVIAQSLAAVSLLHPPCYFS